MKFKYNIGDIVYYVNGYGNKAIGVISYINYKKPIKAVYYGVTTSRPGKKYMLTLLSSAKNSDFLSTTLTNGGYRTYWADDNKIRSITRGQLISEMLHCGDENVRNILGSKLKRWSRQKV